MMKHQDQFHMAPESKKPGVAHLSPTLTPYWPPLPSLCLSLSPMLSQERAGPAPGGWTTTITPSAATVLNLGASVLT